MKKGILTLMPLVLAVTATMMMIPQAKADSAMGLVILNPTDDASIWMQYPDDNYGSSDHMGVRNRYGDISDPDHWEVNALIKFDLSSIPPGARIDSATLYLYYYDCAFNNCQNRDLTCHRITSGWNEGTVTWNTRPDTTSVATSHSIVPPNYSWMDWDVTSDVQDFVDGHETNYGWEIMDTTTWREFDIPDSRFRAKEFGDYVPYLEITYSYDVTIGAYCYTCDVKGAPVAVDITMDGSPTGEVTPHTFTGLTGTHTFTVPDVCPSAHPFQYWHTGETSTTITVEAGGTYTAAYQVPATPALTQWGLIVLVVLLVLSAWVVLRRRRAVVSRQ
jgi:hypothetical protein